MKTVFEQWCEIIKEQAELNIRLQYLQYHCPHERVKVFDWSDNDSYWTEHKCSDCGKFWSEDQ